MWTGIREQGKSEIERHLYFKKKIKRKPLNYFHILVTKPNSLKHLKMKVTSELCHLL